jgi:peptidoglycan hydrolase-like protein with peptidoglycan-binding domain
VILVGPDGSLARATMDVGGLDPVEETSGVQKRLVNLGHYRGPVDGEPSVDLTAAIRAFQSANGLEPTGEPDDATREKLRKVHGC